MRDTSSSDLRSKPAIVSSRTSGSASARNCSSLHARLVLSWRSLAWNGGVFCWASARSASPASSTTDSKSALLHLGCAITARPVGEAISRAASTSKPARILLSPSDVAVTHRLDGGRAQVGVRTGKVLGPQGTRGPRAGDPETPCRWLALATSATRRYGLDAALCRTLPPGKSAACEAAGTGLECRTELV